MVLMKFLCAIFFNELTWLGAYMVVKIIIEMVRMKLAGSNDGIGSLIEDLEEPLESTELRMNVIAEPRHVKAKAVEVIEAFRQYIEVLITRRLSAVIVN